MEKQPLRVLGRPTPTLFPIQLLTLKNYDVEDDDDIVTIRRGSRLQLLSTVSNPTISQAKPSLIPSSDFAMTYSSENEMPILEPEVTWFVRELNTGVKAHIPVSFISLVPEYLSMVSFHRRCNLDESKRLFKQSIVEKSGGEEEEEEIDTDVSPKEKEKRKRIKMFGKEHDPFRVNKEGWLKKCGKYHSRFYPRFVRIERSTLSYYRIGETLTPAGLFELDGTIVKDLKGLQFGVEVPEYIDYDQKEVLTDKERRRRAIPFKERLRKQGKVRLYRFLAESKEEKKEWMDMIWGANPDYILEDIEE
ncbi:hypothetical protein ADUPG1_006839 [Aduncisulcus paluster]|uniref:PH domain-containing protein n=1 Tax=Aduncisulcus paluster TaxID=2918883 RepID=A0ABQ5KJR4_9EUKA|nr:hypothetical protein ADUPG1_006839 [Aduncisulcus paluster]|eukprot:gnl/Carplike_NY0171/9367_a13073_157.p1 GENE.gnl/Carplike_NY0171/9367_a13073_157~~gnl/Carplike_NY0171/9367_a13073_157.p1  ORF type:complete len:305 (-),score=76.01 gnl/Carplike_NY0171/9367_a13073_157:79-993(-)